MQVFLKIMIIVISLHFYHDLKYFFNTPASIPRFTMIYWLNWRRNSDTQHYHFPLDRDKILTHPENQIFPSVESERKVPQTHKILI